ncbi:MAG: agmatinase [Gemmatimonadaceae bacterium]
MTSGRPTLIGLPYDAGSSYLRGAAEGPAVIRDAILSDSSNMWTEGLIDLGEPGTLVDAGDLTLPLNGPEAHGLIEAGIAALLRDGGRPIALGGDHSVTAPVLRALRPHHPRLTVLHLDAHPDLYDAYDGDPRSHASPFARVMEEGLCDRLVQVGIRTMNGHQRAQADRFGVEVLEMHRWAAGLRPELDGPVYVSLDIDVLDPAFAPGVSHREPGGLSVREVIALLQSLTGPVVGADLVELNPRQDPLGLTPPVAAKLVKELAGVLMRAADPG